MDIAEEDTVLKVKEKLVEMKPDIFQLEGMKLIFSGKILENEKLLLAEYKVKETDFLVAMCPKKPAAPTIDPNLQRLIDMGFGKDQATEALQAAGNNPDIAAEILMGLGNDDEPAPQQVQQQQQSTPEPAQGGAAPAQGGAAVPFPAMGGGGAFPQAGGAFPQAGGMDPSQDQDFIQGFLNQLAQSNPEMFQRFRDNPQEFVTMLQNLQQLSPEERMQALQGLGLGVGGEDDGMGQEEQYQLPEIMQGNLPELTPEEEESVLRLVELGFSQGQALEAYIACDKNENLAANFLFNSM